METTMMTASIKSLEPKQARVKSARKRSNPADWDRFLAGVTRGKTAVEYGSNHVIFKQGEPADSVFYIRSGKVKLGATSEQGKEAIVAVLNGGEFFGEGCLAAQPLRMASAREPLALPREPRRFQSSRPARSGAAIRLGGFPFLAVSQPHASSLPR